MPNPVDEGTHTTASADEETIYTSSTNRVTQLILDVNAMLIGDSFIIREKAKVLTGGSAVLVSKVTLSGADGSLPNGAVVFRTDPLSSPYGVTYTIERDSVTDRAFPWRVDEI